MQQKWFLHCVKGVRLSRCVVLASYLIDSCCEDCVIENGCVLFCILHKISESLLARTNCKIWCKNRAFISLELLATGPNHLQGLYLRVTLKAWLASSMKQTWVSPIRFRLALILLQKELSPAAAACPLNENTFYSTLSSLQSCLQGSVHSAIGTYAVLGLEVSNPVWTCF